MKKDDRARLLASFVIGDAALGIMFVILKLLGYVDWSWKWVTCPFWAPILVICAAILALCIWGAIVSLFGAGKKEERKPDEDRWETK